MLVKNRERRARRRIRSYFAAQEVVSGLDYRLAVEVLTHLKITDAKRKLAFFYLNPEQELFDEYDLTEISLMSLSISTCKKCNTEIYEAYDTENEPYDGGYSPRHMAYDGMCFTCYMESGE